MPSGEASHLPIATTAVHSQTDLTDEALLTRVGAGDREAFSILFERLAPRVKAYVMSLGASESTADDLAQDAMVTMWRRAKSYDRSLAKASTWTFVIARNAWIDRLRREKVEIAYCVRDPPSEQSEDETPEEGAARASDRDRLEAAMATLPEEQQRVVRLSFFEDQPHPEIAARLSLPLGTVKSRLRLALTKLRLHWERSP
jgi:RNA polymerase sigma-70 factor (ECF subfamily)